MKFNSRKMENLRFIVQIFEKAILALFSVYALFQRSFCVELANSTQMSPILMSKTSTVGNWHYFLILIGILQIVSFTGLVFLSTFNPKMPFLFPSILEQRSLTKWQKSVYLALLEQKCQQLSSWRLKFLKMSIHFFQRKWGTK